MTTATPLQLAGAALMELFDYTHNPVPKRADNIVCSFQSPLSGDACIYTLDVEWHKSQLALSLSLTTSFDISLLRLGNRITKSLGRSLEPFLEDRYEAPGMVALSQDQAGVSTPLFVSELDYAPLEDNEIQDEFSLCVTRGLYSLELLGPIFTHMAQGYWPTAYERLRWMTITSGLWEVTVSENNHKHTISLPPQLFGGITELRAN